MIREIIFYKSYFLDFYKALQAKQKEKIKYVLELIRQVERMPEKFLKSIAGTKRLYEIRVEYESNIFRIFCCFDEGKLVVLLNAFQKKTQKTPRREQERAKFLMKEYFKQKEK